MKSLDKEMQAGPGTIESWEGIYRIAWKVWLKSIWRMVHVLG
jgi:hypothetical protein